MNKGKTAFPLLLLALVLVSGCESNAPNVIEPTRPDLEEILAAARGSGYDLTVSILDDGVVTSAEYDVAFEHFEECVLGEGLGFENLGTNPVDSLTYVYSIEFGDMREAEAAALAEECQKRFHDDVTAWYIYTVEPSMDPDMREFVYECMEERGQSVSRTEENFADLVADQLNSQERIDVATECIIEAMRAVHPEIPYVFIAY